LLFGFGCAVPAALPLPEGRGFRVSVEALDGREAAGWIALVVDETADIELFVSMALDVIAALNRFRDAEQTLLIEILVGRIRAWQDFLERRRANVLSPEAELGLLGELELLRAILQLGVQPDVAVLAWMGPLHGLHDFVLGVGAIEVKTTVIPGPLHARFSTLAQLDDSMRPVFLAVARFVADATGRALPDVVDALRTALAGAPQARQVFEERLLRAGFLDVFSSAYVRGFQEASIGIIPVDDHFPRLIPSNVPAAVVEARYTLDLASEMRKSIPLEQALRQLSVIT
jgi:DNA-binding PucR family transcriptional regulator